MDLKPDDPLFPVAGTAVTALEGYDALVLRISFLTGPSDPTPVLSQPFVLSSALASQLAQQIAAAQAILASGRTSPPHAEPRH